MRGGRAWLLLACSVVAAGQTPAPGGRNVSSSNQVGGITAWWVGNVVINRAPTPDPVNARMVAAMSAYRDLQLADATTKLEGDEGATYYAYLVDDSWPSGADGRLRTWSLVATESDDLGPLAKICDVNEDIALAGYVQTIDRGSGSVTMEPLDASAARLFSPICRGLARPLSELTGTASAPGDEPPTIFDALARGRSQVAISFFPGRLFGKDFEATIGRYFWVPAMQARYGLFRSVQERMESPEAFQALSNVASGGRGVFVVGAAPAPGEGLAAFPTEARREFGDRLARFDAEWARYLSTAGMSVRGRELSGMPGAAAGARLQRWSISQIGTVDFWRGASDVYRATELSACVGGQFLAAKGYRIQQSSAEFARCAMSKRGRRS